MTAAFLALIHNIALLLAIALLLDVAKLHPLNTPRWLQKTLLGLGLGVVGVFIMLTPWQFSPGIIFDTRSILLSISGLFFGAVPTLVAMLITAGLRLFQGGAAAWTGVSVIFATGTLGIAWRYARRTPLANMPLRELYLFGMLSHLIMLALMFTLPIETALRVLSNITLPVLILYPLGTLLLGSLLRSRLQREHTEDRVRDSEEHYRLLADNISDVLWILNLDTLQWEYMSPSVERLRGYTVDEVMTQPMPDVMTPESYAEVEKALTEQLAAAERGEGLEQAFVNEVEQTCKDGSTVWTEVVTRYARNKDGQLTLLGISRDITERKAAEDALRASEDNFRRLVEDAPISIVVQTDGKFSYVNSASVRLFGVQSKDHLMGQSVIDYIHPDDRQTVRERIDTVNIRRAEAPMAELRIQRADGTSVEVESYGVPFVLFGKKSSLGFMQDISGRKEVERTTLALAMEREHMSMLTSFVEDVSHEFRTPLSIVEADLYLLERLTDIDARRQKVTEIKQQFTGLTRLIEVLAKSTQIYTDKAQSHETLDLNGLVGSTVDSLQSDILPNGPTFLWTPMPNLPSVDGNAGKLHVALSEIIANALRFSAPEGHVTVRSGRHPDGVMVEIHDDGPGMPADVIPHIFKRFYRQDIAHTTPGLGLGLSMAQTIVNDHGGRIEVESEPGEGSLFRVVLPAAKRVE
ncbi:MAG: PAS domain S-box protein [Caldilineaceae bacterium]